MDTGDAVPELLRRWREGDQAAAARLYGRYAQELLRLSERHLSRKFFGRVDGEDVVQSVFRTFFRRAAQWQYDVPEGEELWKLFLVIALHKIRETAAFHRASKRDVGATATGPGFDRAARRVAAQDQTALTTLQLVIDEVLDTLAPSHRPIVELRIEGYEVDEIARRTQRSRRSVERALQEFRNRLRGLIREDA